MAVDATHDPARRSWVASANGHPDFPIQNLPLGVFSPPGGTPRGGVAIGDMILELGAVAPLLSGEARRAAEAAAGPALNPLLALGAGPRRALRGALSDLLAEGSAQHEAAAPHLHEAEACALHLPARIGDYTDFFAGIHHATNTGRLFRPDNPLLPNYKYVPVAYHGRASSVRPSGTGVRRPRGQRKPPSDPAPSFGPSRNLDYEMELGIWIGPGNALGEPIPIGEAAQHVAGFCLLNDWSARDIQGWEYQPLGPFLAKNFCTSISPWIVTSEALAPFRIPQPQRPEGDPAPMDYLMDATDQAEGGLDIALEVLLLTPGMREKGMRPHRLSLGNARHLYWTVAQMVAHHTVGGCNLMPGDLFGSGTVSTPGPDGFGSLLEITEGGRRPVALPSGEERRFLEDGDEVIFRARAEREGFAPIGFGECRGTVLPAQS
ncbi:fumarylacetoacetase [Crenalkalicoccus roseus]|uniref:fumarylacetoacetase n=1 Tax=Crenalkalicoccus roseus TaxID=1485588 RepID=UPI001863BFA7|nr:fumarylacetoacetase [Crenalkalicoccus roseus]